MNPDLLLQITSVILLFVSLLLAVFLLTVKTKNKTGNLALTFFLIINGIDTGSFFYHNYINVHPTIEMLRIEIGAFFQKPLLFIFVISVLYSDFKLKPKHLLHLLPFAASALVLMPRFYLAGYDDKITLFVDHKHRFEGTFSIVLAHLQSVFYIIAIFVILQKYRKILLQNYSISDKFNYKWLMQMNIILSILFVVSTVKNYYKYWDLGNEITLYRLSITVALLGFICWITLKAMYAPRIFTGIDSQLQLVSPLQTSSVLNISENIPPVENFEYSWQINRVREYMLKHEPFLNPDLTIQNLADQLEMNVRDLSLLINQQLNRNFYDFIAQYRVDKAKDMLKMNNGKKLTILKVLYHVGFNTKSSFNTSFKKFTGLTPTEYRRMHQESRS